MTKGIALLLEAFDRLSISNAELRIMGGWSTRSVRRRIQNRIAQDPRITVQPGDPLPVLQKADVFVHPSYEDGFGYAPMEALACGVPVVVTEDTGMKEYVRDGVAPRRRPGSDCSPQRPASISRAGGRLPRL